MPELPDDTKKWFLLSKSEIKYVLDTCNVNYKALILLMACTGMRRNDVLNLTIEDFMKSTYKYHHLQNVDEFISNAPKDMIRFFDFFPQKTRRYKIRCKVFCTPETSNMIMLMLRERKQLLEQNHPELSIEKEDNLFTSRKKKYKKSIHPDSLTNVFLKKEKKLQHERKRVLKKKYDENIITKNEYVQLLDEEPSFTPHALRKYFISTVAEHVSNLHVCAVFEGHSAPMSLDEHYVQLTDDYLRNEYMKLVPALSFKQVTVDFLSSKRKRELEAEIVSLRRENRNIKESIRDEAVKAVSDLLDDYFHE